MLISFRRVYHQEEHLEMKAISDEPVGSVDLSHDTGGFNSYASSLAKVIIHSCPEFTIGIHGEWGTGKTTLMRKIAFFLEEENRKSGIMTAVPVWFNAWRYEREEHHAIIPLLDTIRNQISSIDGLSNLRKVLKSISKGMRGTTLNLGIVTIPLNDVFDDTVGSGSTTRLETIYYGELGTIKKALDEINEKRKVNQRTN
jgi:Cdc6-like AAA superfamily ATPase